MAFVVSPMATQMKMSNGLGVKHDSWYDGECVNISPANEPDKFFCCGCV